ncbi:helix-turn-helix domain-containing protein [Occultella kanbiaonis]|uniref:helix-turn-helix domain-containing protein n=1 Tax=Occultella kanbiaonis TaxID=2675754 RepID=UPI0013D5259C|nr:helix-turn-helix transcriptional regulator [Occultella kanbiaonis]
MSSDLANLARHVTARRNRLGLSQVQIWNAGGPSNSTLTKIESATPPEPSAVTLRKLDAALGWEKGSARRVLDGGDPIELPAPEPDKVRGLGAGVGMLLTTNGDRTTIPLEVDTAAVKDAKPGDLFEARAIATAAFLARLREIRQERDRLTHYDQPPMFGAHQGTLGVDYGDREDEEHARSAPTKQAPGSGATVHELPLSPADESLEPVAAQDDDSVAAIEQEQEHTERET